MKKNGRRVLGLLLLLIMMFTLVPSPNIFALEDEEESAAAASEATLEEQMVDIANEILEDINGEDQEEPEPDTEPVTEADPAEEEALVTEEETSEEETPEGDHAENEDSEESLPEADPEEESENEPEATDEVANTVLPEDSEEDEEPKEVTESEEETVSEEEPEEDEEEEELLEETEDEEYDVPYTAEAANFEVTAVTSNKAFDIPVTLVASVIPEDDSAFKEAEDALVDSGKQYDGMLALDIHFEDENQNEVEPDSPVKVSFKVKKAVIEEVAFDTALIVPETVEVNHITSGEGGETLVDTVAAFADGTDGNVAIRTSSTSEGESIEQIDASFEVDRFSTFLITWDSNDPSEPYSATVHYVDESGNELEDPVSLDCNAASMSLDIIIDGYLYQGANYLKGSTNYSLESKILTKVKGEDGKAYWTMQANVIVQDGEFETQTLPIEDESDIYVYYVKKSDGYDPPDPSPSSIQGPTTTKSVTSNGDGTYKIRLDVVGHANQTEEKVAANVIVIMDITQSMTNRMPGSTQTRMAAAKSALNTLIDTLNPGTGDNQNHIYFTAVNFGNSSNYSNGVTWTDSAQSMRNYVSGLPNSPTDMGTCWQAGLQGGIDRANQVPTNENLKNNKTYILFVTDGNPNCYTDNQGRWHSAQSANYSEAAYSAAVPNADTLSGLGDLYGIFVGDADGFDHLDDLITSDSNGIETINGNDTDTLETAFENIGKTIVSELATQVVVDDGVPSIATVSSAVSGSAGGFNYYIKPKNGTERTWEEAPSAAYSSSNGVTWDLSNAGALADGTTYSLEFTVWPSQEAYDLIADLNNGITDYDHLDEATQAAVTGSKEDGYTLVTNTHLGTTYKFRDQVYSDPAEEVPSAAMPLPTETIGVEKIWNNLIDQRNPPAGVKLILTRDGENYLYGDNAIEVSANTGWKKDNIYISLGQITKNADGTSYTVIESGHDYEIIEPQNNPGDYHWELTSEVYHPMVINGTATMLIKDEDATGTEGTNYYKIDGVKYKVPSSSTSNYLKAWNDRRSWLQIEKKVGENAPAGALFDFAITINEANKDNIWFSAYNSDVIVKDLQVDNATAEEGNTGYFYAASGSVIKVKIEAGWTLRFINLPSGTTYNIQETESTLPDGFAFDKAESRYEIDTTVQQDTPATPTISGSTVTGTINVPNVEFYVDYYNKYEETSVKVTKTWDDANNQDGLRPNSVSVQLEVGEGESKKAVVRPTDEEGNTDNPVTLSATNNWTYTWTKVPKYVAGQPAVFSVSETEVPTGYEVEVTGNATDGFVVKNIHTPEVIDVGVEKVWDDNNNSSRPASIQVQLKAGNTSYGDPVTLDASKEWKYTWDNLPKYASGTEITYTVDETSIPDGYTKTVSGDAAKGFIITNKYVTVSVTATKVWDDHNNQDGKRADVVFNLLADGTVVQGQNQTISKDATGDNLTVTWTELPAYKNGVAITYSVKEQGVTEDNIITMNGVEYTVTVENGEEGFEITNSYTPEVITTTIKKVWDDGEDQDGIRPESVDVVLKGSDNKTYTVTLDGTPAESAPEGTDPVGYEIEPWIAKFVNLPKNAAGQAITYTASETTTEVITKENDGPGTYKYEVEGSLTNGFVITNTHTPAEVEVVVQKKWEDNNSPSRPKSITIHLLADGVDTEKKVVLDGTPEETVPTDAAEYESAAWEATFSNLPKYKKTDTGDSEVIVYTVSEDAVEGYKTTYTYVYPTSEYPTSSEGNVELASDDEAQTDSKAEADTGDEGGTVTEETTVETIKATVTNTLTLIDIEIYKTVINLYDAGGDSNATFVFEVTVGAKEKPRYHSYVGITFDGETGTKSIILSGIPYEKGDEVTVEEVYTAGHKELTDLTIKDWEIEDLLYIAEFTNTFDDIPYSSGIVNTGGHDPETGKLVIEQQEETQVIQEELVR